MTAPAAPRAVGAPARFFLAAAVAVGLLVGAAGAASAASSPAAQNAVGASTVALASFVGLSGDVSPATHLESYDSQAKTASATGVAANTAQSLPTRAEAADLLKASRPVGSALKNDAMHRAGDWVIDDVAQSGSVFELVGGDGVSRTLVQMPGEVNGVAGRFEWIMEGQDLTHQLFVRGGTINGIPIKP